jgi:hypothetical protein
VKLFKHGILAGADMADVFVGMPHSFHPTANNKK